MSKTTARIKAVRSRKAMSQAEQLQRIDAIVAETEEEEAEAEDEETDEEAPPPPEDEETEDAAEGDEEETEAEDEEEDAEAEDEEEEPTAKRARAALKSARRIAASKEAKANPAFALSAIAGGVSYASFKALAPAAGRGSNLASRMENEPGAQRLRPDSKASGGKNVVNLKPAADYYAAADGRKRG